MQTKFFHYRFYCAAAVDNRSRLDFHGERRIWDGHSIKRKIKGNSALYILIEEVLYNYLLSVLLSVLAIGDLNGWRK